MFAIESLAVFIEAIAFLIPGKVGADEGGRVLIFKALGYAPAIGLGFSIFRRVKELFWATFCLTVLALLKRHADRAVEVAVLAGPPVAPAAPPG